IPPTRSSANIRRAAALPLAYQFSNPNRPLVENEYEHVKPENDWTSRQVARFPDRLWGRAASIRSRRTHDVTTIPVSSFMHAGARSRDRRGGAPGPPDRRGRRAASSGTETKPSANGSAVGVRTRKRSRNRPTAIGVLRASAFLRHGRGEDLLH